MTTIAVKIACLIGLSLFAMQASAAAPPKRDLPIAKHAQKASKLCWAAVGEMAVNAVAHPNPPMTQERQAAYAVAGVTALPIPPDKVADFDAAVPFCKANLPFCDERGDPMLEGVKQELPVSVQALPQSKFISEIGEAGSPVIFAWQYPDNHDVPNVPMRGHYFIVTGYDTAKPSEFLKVWDPWPVNVGDETPMSHSQYKNPVLDMGLTATLLRSMRGLRKEGETSTAPNPPTSLTIDGGAASSQPIQGEAAESAAERAARSIRPKLREVAFSTAANRSLPKRQRGEILRERSARRADSAALTAGEPFPILALHINAIVANQGTPERLLRTRTTSALYPVMLGDEVVDSFLMANVGGRWVQTGYSNTAITRQLVRWRQQNMAESGRKEKDFFVISVPQYSAFFTSFNPGPDAMAIAATTDETIGTLEGQAQRAVVVIRNIANAELKPRGDRAAP